jgi:hypothetical protein
MGRRNLLGSASPSRATGFSVTALDRVPSCRMPNARSRSRIKPLVTLPLVTLPLVTLPLVTMLFVWWAAARGGARGADGAQVRV